MPDPTTASMMAQSAERDQLRAENLRLREELATVMAERLKERDLAELF